MLCGRSGDDREADTPIANGNAIEICRNQTYCGANQGRILQKHAEILPQPGALTAVNADHDFLPFPRPDQARGNLGLEYKVSSIFPLSRLRGTNV